MPKVSQRSEVLERIGSTRQCRFALLAITFVLGGTISPTPGRAEQITSDAKDGDFYIKSASMQCGNTTVSIISNCVSIGERGEEPFCFSQLISLVDKRSRVAKSILYEHGMRKNGMKFIIEIGCLYHKRQVAIMSTNFANCGTCEWTDVYNLNGEYQGSDGDPGRDLPFAYKRLGPAEAEKLIKNSDAPSIVIDRNQ